MASRSRKPKAVGLSFDIKELEAVIAAVEKIPRRSAQAFAVALEKGLNDGQQIAVTEIGKTLHLDPSYIAGKLSVKIDKKGQQGSLQAPISPVLLTRYPYTQNRTAPTRRVVQVRASTNRKAHKRTVISTTAGYTLKVRKDRGAEKWPGAFVIKATRGKVGTDVLVTRKNRNTHKMRALYGPSVGSSLNYNAERIQPKVVERIEQYYNQALEKGL